MGKDGQGVLGKRPSKSRGAKAHILCLSHSLKIFLSRPNKTKPNQNWTGFYYIFLIWGVNCGWTKLQSAFDWWNIWRTIFTVCSKWTFGHLWGETWIFAFVSSNDYLDRGTVEDHLLLKILRKGTLWLASSVESCLKANAMRWGTER